MHAEIYGQADVYIRCSLVQSGETSVKYHRRRSDVFIVNMKHFIPCSNVSIVNFEHVIDGWNQTVSRQILQF